MCKQTHATHDKKSIHDCASGIINFNKRINIGKFAVYKIEHITFIPSTAENQYTAIPKEESKIHVLWKYKFVNSKTFHNSVTW